MSLPTPNTRKEQYLNAIATGNASGLPTPITREEEYLDAIAKGGGSGDGDMKKSVYDSDLDVAGAGGIKAFVNSAVAGKVDKVEGKGLSTNDYTDEDKAIVDGVTDALAEKADTEDIPDLVSDNLAKGILGNETVLSTDNILFVSKTMGAGKYQRKKFVGCSFVWNQLVDSNTESVTIASGHKYALYQNGAWSIGASSGTAIAVTGGSDLFTDLTQLFGSTAIADYIYNLEQATAGAGVAKLKELGFFTEDYYTYDAGSVQSVDIKEYAVTGKNMLGGDAMLANAIALKGTGDRPEIDTTNKIIIVNAMLDSNRTILSFDKVLPNTQYTIILKVQKSADVFSNLALVYTDGTSTNFPSLSTINIPDTIKLLSAPNKTISHIKGVYSSGDERIYTDGSGLFLGDVSINDYEPYHKSTYPLTPTELRGVPRIDANNNIYADGDEYASDGGHTEKYDIVDLGTLNWVRSIAANGTYYLYAALSNKLSNANMICTAYPTNKLQYANMPNKSMSSNNAQWFIDETAIVLDSDYTDAADFKAAMSGQYLVYEKATPTTETLTSFDYPQSVGSLEEITDYKVEQEDRDVAIPTGHVTEYMGKGGEFTLPTLPETPSVLVYDGHNFFWKPETA